MGEIRATPPIRYARRPPGRNDPCFCGSGRKFKRCCGSNVRRSAVPKVAEPPTPVPPLSRLAVAGSLWQQGIDPVAAYAYTRVGEISWFEAKSEYLQMSEESRTAFWAAANEALKNDTAQTAGNPAAA